MIAEASLPFLILFFYEHIFIVAKAKLYINLAGVKVTVKSTEVTCKARLLFALADLTAKAALFNVTQFNGEYGCPSCLHPGEQVLYNSMHI